MLHVMNLSQRIPFHPFFMSCFEAEKREKNKNLILGKFPSLFVCSWMSFSAVGILSSWHRLISIKSARHPENSPTWWYRRKKEWILSTKTSFQHKYFCYCCFDSNNIIWKHHSICQQETVFGIVDYIPMNLVDNLNFSYL